MHLRAFLTVLYSAFLAVCLFSAEVQAQFHPQYEIRLAYDVGKTVVDYFGSEEKARAQIYAYLIEVDKVLREQLGARLRIVYEEYHSHGGPYSSFESVFEISPTVNERFSEILQPVTDFDYVFSFHYLEDREAGSVFLEPYECSSPPEVLYSVINLSRFYRFLTIGSGDASEFYLDGSTVRLSRDLLLFMNRNLFGTVFSNECEFLQSETFFYCEDSRRIDALLGVGQFPCDEFFEPYLDCPIQAPRLPFFDPALIPAKRAKLEELSACGVAKISGELNSVLPFTLVPNLSKPGDSDGDTVSDATEAAESTNPNDRGSKREQISSPIYAPWNGFQAQTNVLETINRGATEAFVSITIFDLSGSPGETLRYNLSPGEQRDIIVNAMRGFSENAYGVMEVEFSGDIDGRVFFYKNDTTVAGDYEFAFGIPFLDPVFGPTAVGFNTFQPGTSPEAGDDPAVSFLSIVNLSSSSQLYHVFKYNQKGDLLNINPVRVGSFGRVDVEAGHQNPGRDFVGLVRIVPDNNDAGYIAFLNRYGLTRTATPSGSFIADELQFAFPLIATPGTGEWIHAPVSTTRGGDPWVEIINVSAEAVGVQVQFRAADGSLLQATNEFLPAYAQKHIYAGALLGSNAQGFVSLKGGSRESVIAQTMFYFRDAEGNMDSMYGSQARQALPLTQRGSYNLFLNQDAELTVINPNNASFNGSITVFDSSNSGIIGQRSISPQGRLTETLRGKPEFSLLADTVGVVQVNPGSTPLIAELLRVRISPSTGRVDYVAPTAIR